MEPLRECDILEALDAGDRALAFARLCRAYGTRGYSLARRLVRDDSLAEDVMQEALLQISQALPTLRERERLHAWIMSIVAHRAIDELRRRKRRLRFFVDDGGDAEAVSAGPSPADGLKVRDDVRALEDALATLPADTRAAVLLRFGDELSFDEIGVALGLAPDTVRVRVSRALPLLARRLARRRPIQWTKARAASDRSDCPILGRLWPARRTVSGSRT